jgi:hypothetical protein
VCYFEKLQFEMWGPTEMTEAEMFSSCISPHFSGDYKPCQVGSPGARKTQRVLCTGSVIEMDENVITVTATQPEGLGIVTTATEIFAKWDDCGEFERIHFVPFQDTLPRVYAFDVFTDYLRPYLLANKTTKFASNDIFQWQGVEFKVVCCDPEGRRRVGKNTTIYSEGVLHPTLRDRLPPELLVQVSQLPVGLQMMLLNQPQPRDELQEMLQAHRGCTQDIIERLETFEWPGREEEQTSTTSCMICLDEFEDKQPCHRLPCKHVFHSACVLEWLRRCTDCPLCKTNVQLRLLTGA